MRRRARIVAVVGMVGVAAVLAFAWRARDLPDEEVKEPCAYYAGNCTFVAPFTAGQFRMSP
jgi:hypothetical protein